MNETLVSFLLAKLRDTLFREAVSTFSVGGKVELLVRELNRIHCFLRDAERKSGRDERVRNWVLEVRKLSIWIDDTIDTFLLDVDELNVQRMGVADRLRRAFKLPRRTFEIGKEIDKILARINEIAGSRVNYGIENLGESSESEVVVPFKRVILADLDQTELIGFGADKENIISRLLDQRTLRRSVVSIVGTGGLGKTTLAQKAYSSEAVKSQFGVRMWIPISQEYKLIDLLKKMLSKVRPLGDLEENHGVDHFMEELNKSLRDHKYLIVMDDVWSADLWPQIVAALPDIRNGSRVLITSRILYTAEAADPLSEPYKLPFLKVEESLELLLKTALPGRDANDCPTYLLDVAKRLAEKCDGLPLALVVLGGLLSLKPPIRNVWEKVLNTMVWGVDGKKCMDILSTSFDDMPVSLKYCFMDLACFPKNCEISAKDITRLWVVEGFIPHESRKIMEDTAEDYLEELAQRSMVIVVRRCYNNSIKTIRIHDLLHDLAIDRAKEDFHVTVVSKREVNSRENTLIRRMSLQFYSDNEVMEHTRPNLRSLHSFGIRLHDCSRYKLLKVLNLVGQVGNVIGKLPQRLTQLRFLRCDDTSVKDLIRGPYVGYLKNLWVLDLRAIGFVDEFPVELWGIKTLRHVLLRKGNNIPGPSSGAMLQNLQTLKYIQDSNSWQIHLPQMPRLRCLKLKVCVSPSLATIANLLQTLENLSSLNLDSLYWLSITQDIADMRAFPFYQCLENLKLSGKWPRSLNLQAIMLPPNLIKLQLNSSYLEHDPMPELERLQILKILILDAAYSGQKMICSAGGFPSLEHLEISNCEELDQITVEEAAMPSLKLLKIKRCDKLRRSSIHLNCVQWEQ